MNESSAGNGEEPPSCNQLSSLKEFKSAGRGFWSDVPDADWNDWRWQLRHRITSVEQLQKLMPTLTPEEFAGSKLANMKLALAITPYFFNVIDPADEQCPIRWQVIPRVEETHIAPWEMSDPCGEDSHSPVPGLVHRYPDRVLFLVTDRCASYCRYCTRSRLVSNATGYDFHPEFDRQIQYIRDHLEVRDVLLSGGDPLLFSDEKLEYLLSRLVEEDEPTRVVGNHRRRGEIRGELTREDQNEVLVPTRLHGRSVRGGAEVKRMMDSLLALVDLLVSSRLDELCRQFS